jgi:hypothetical protein
VVWTDTNAQGTPQSPSNQNCMGNKTSEHQVLWTYKEVRVTWRPQRPWA